MLSRVTSFNAHLIAKAVNGRISIDIDKQLEVRVFGIIFNLILREGIFELEVLDPLGRKEDSSRLLPCILNAIDRALNGRLVTSKGRLINFSCLQGGSVAKLYEKKILDFLVTEMDGSRIDEVKETVSCVGGVMVEHLSASWSFEVTPINGVRIRITFWQGGEEMPSGANIMVGEEVKEVNLPIEELVTLTEIVTNRLVLFYRKVSGEGHEPSNPYTFRP
ncbi:MAG: DUF3786 domain-containing protein [Candidatus Nezhaarchaeales archaeon]